MKNKIFSGMLMSVLSLGVFTSVMAFGVQTAHADNLSSACYNSAAGESPAYLGEQDCNAPYSNTFVPTPPDLLDYTYDPGYGGDSITFTSDTYCLDFGSGYGLVCTDDISSLAY
jgi:hypothetical protein